MIGTALVSNGYPLYYDAVNEKGLCMAGLNFPGNAVYLDPVSGKENVAQFELLPWILGQCDSVNAAKERLRRLHITSDNFAEGLPSAELHWIIADSHQAVTVEAVREGLHIYENPVGVLTNNPPFPMQMFALNNYMHLTPEEPQNHLAKDLPLRPYSLGLGALGLPGDLSSQSRFVRAAFTKLNATAGSTEEENVNQFFHILELSSRRRAAAGPRTETAKRPSIRPAATRTKESTTTPPMAVIRLPQCSCARQNWTQKSYHAGPCSTQKYLLYIEEKIFIPEKMRSRPRPITAREWLLL